MICMLSEGKEVQAGTERGALEGHFAQILPSEFFELEAYTLSPVLRPLGQLSRTEIVQRRLAWWIMYIVKLFLCC